MYSLNLPVSTIRTKIRQEFERHRYVQQLQTVDVLLFKSHSEFQVRLVLHSFTIEWQSGNRTANRRRPGNAQLLEAIDACAQVLQNRGGSKGEATEQLHWWLFGSKCCVLDQIGLQSANAVTRDEIKRDQS
jgi:hypothetical protein